jgi:hypothetical protein
MPLLLLLFGNMRAAVGESYHEVTGGFNASWSNSAPLPNGDVRGGIGFGGGAGYIYHFNPQLSLRTGLEVNRYGGSSYLRELKETSTVDIPDNWFWTGDKSFELRSHFSGYLVQHAAWYVQIPLLFVYEASLPWTEWLRWYVGGGFKAGYSLAGKSSATIDSIYLEGFFNYEGYSIDDLKNLLGFGSYLNERRDATLKLGFSATGYVEIGLKQKLADHYHLYCGIFGEYSLYSAVADAANPNMYEYKATPPSSGGYYNIRYTPASHISGASSRTFYPMALGVTVRLSFDTKREKVSNKRMLQMRYMEF